MATATDERKSEVDVQGKTDVKRYPYYVENPQETDRVRTFLDIFASVLRHTNYGAILNIYSRAVTKCARCAGTCQIYQATGEERDIPCSRSNLLLDVYRRHFTTGGIARSRLLGDPGLTEDDIDVMLDSYYRCTVCRRCTIECPMGIDHGLVTHLARYILSEMGIVPKALAVSVREQLEGATGNTSAIPSVAMIDTVEFLEEELEEDKGIPIKLPVDRDDVEYIFFPAVSDYLLEADTLMGNAAVLYAAGDGDNWTISSGYFDGINYGLFYSDWILERILQKEIGEARNRKAKKILIGECGHASRSAKAFVPSYANGEEIPVIGFLEYTYEALQQGKLDLDPDVVTERVTYHDPCNMARSGWIVDQPRAILRAFVKDFVEMTPHGRENYCCGGGSGLVSVDEIHDFRMRIAGKAKAEQIKRTGASIVIAPCANCKKQLKEINDYYELNVEIMGLHDLILRAIRLKAPVETVQNQNI